MRISWKLGRVAGIDLFLHPTFLILLAVVGLNGGGGLPAVAMVTAAFGCILLHELGHALAARRFGIPTADITLYPFGGVARLSRMPEAPRAEVLVAVAGPAVNLLLAAVLGGLLVVLTAVDPYGTSLLGDAVWFFRDLLAVNLGLAVFNMIPAFPMDGGRVLRALLSVRMGRTRATVLAATLGQLAALAMPLATMALGVFSVFHLALAGFLYMTAGSELSRARDDGPRDGDDGPRGRRDSWTTPPGYRWESRGGGAWQLAPIVVTAGSGSGRGRGRRWS